MAEDVAEDALLPNVERAAIPEAKITQYLLNPHHPEGRYKANAFRLLGFSQDNPEAFASALRAQHLVMPAKEVEPNQFGRKFVILAELMGPNGRSRRVQSVWIVRHGEDFPRLLSAYPR